MTPILGLDLGTKTGWAIRTAAGRVTSGHHELTLRRGESPGMRFLRFRAFLRELLELGELGPGSVVAYEQAHHRGGHATSLAVGLVTVALEEAAARELETAPVHTGTLKKFATGSGAAGKPAMIEAAQELFGLPDLTSDDEADALHVLAWAADELGERVIPPG